MPSMRPVGEELSMVAFLVRILRGMAPGLLADTNSTSSTTSEPRSIVGRDIFGVIGGGGGL